MKNILFISHTFAIFENDEAQSKGILKTEAITCSDIPKDMCVHIDKRPQNIVFENPSLAVMKNCRHSADGEPSVKYSDNTSTSIRINSSLISVLSCHFKVVSREKDRSCACVCARKCVCVDNTSVVEQTMVAGGWRTISQERNETLAGRRSSCGELCLLLC